MMMEMERFTGRPVYTVSNVSYKTEFLDLPKALTKVPAGARLLLDKGEYSEHFCVNMPVRVEGNGRSETRLQDFVVGKGGKLTLSGVSVRGVVRVEEGGTLDVEDADLTQMEPFSCLRISPGSSASLRDCEIGGQPEAIEVEDGGLILERCAVTAASRGRAAVVGSGPRTRIHMSSSAIRAAGARGAVCITGGGTFHADRSLFEGFTQVGLLASGGGECTLRRNTFRGGVRAAVLAGCIGEVIDNRFGDGERRCDISDDCSMKCEEP
eukprot:Hpha_TRINITY_DN33463_c0_g1::TRINITY_DN33463_c0_g1_i1::g.855::m.855